jgi:hypothetical protein
MPDASTAIVPRPPLAFRVGVTGARVLDAAAIDRLRPAVRQILDLAARELMRHADDPAARRAYEPAPSGAPLTTLRLVSPLAEGSERLVAEEALKAGYELYAPLPFPQAEYEKDFPDTVDAFRALLKCANDTLELDGARAELENESYQEVGRFVVRNCDLLIAIWDGARERGPGGSAEIIRIAARAELPVWWIDASGANAPKLIENPAHVGRPDLAPTGDSAVERITGYIEKAAVPPELPSLELPGVFGFAALRLCRLLKRDDSPLIGYLDEKPIKSGFLWGSYDRMMDAVAPGPGHDALSLGSAANAPEHWWSKYFEAADKLSVGYGDRYRSSYVLIAAFAFLALAAAAVGSVLPKNFELRVASAEIVALLGIAVLLLMNQVRRWHERWISYRLLAELCRKQYVLSSIGQALPRSEVVRMSLDAEAPPENGAASPEALPREQLPREAWVAWYFTAALRAAPFLTGSLTTEKFQALKLAQSLMARQIQYHSLRRNRDKAASERIDQIGQVCFLLTIVSGAVKLVSLWMEHAMSIALSATFVVFLSAASAAFVGIRAYSEFSLLVEQSKHMLRIMKERGAEFDAIDLDQPLSSRDLGLIMYELAMEMMHDVTGWAQLFRIKTLEA